MHSLNIFLDISFQHISDGRTIYQIYTWDYKAICGDKHVGFDLASTNLTGRTSNWNVRKSPNWHPSSVVLQNHKFKWGGFHSRNCDGMLVQGPYGKVYVQVKSASYLINSHWDYLTICWLTLSENMVNNRLQESKNNYWNPLAKPRINLTKIYLKWNTEITMSHATTLFIWLSLRSNTNRKGNTNFRLIMTLISPPGDTCVVMRDVGRRRVSCSNPVRGRKKRFIPRLRSRVLSTVHSLLVPPKPSALKDQKNK